MSFLEVFLNVIFPIVLIVGVSAFAARKLKPNPRTLSSVTLYLFTPLLVLDGMANSDLRPGEVGEMAAIVIVLAVILTVIGLALSRLLKFDQKLESAFLLTILLMNAANYGLPLNNFAFGETGYQRAMVYYVMSTVVANTFGVFLASRGSTSIREAALNVLRVPLLYGLVFGLVLNFTDTALPLPLQRVVSLMGDAAVPTMMVLLGMNLTNANLKGHIGPIALATGIKLVLAPLIAVGLTAIFGMSGINRQVAILQSGMPTAIISGVLATEFGSDAEFTTAVILVSTVASVLTLSVLLVLVG
jgi:predicted permease